MLEVDQVNPYFEIGKTLYGHEFHYSRIVDWEGTEFPLAFKVRRGVGLDGRRDGLCYKNVLATYSHVHHLGTQGWAKGLFDQAVLYSQQPDEKRKNTSLRDRQFPVALNF